jgi:hypothetical protein
VPSEAINNVIAAIEENRRRFEQFCYSLSDEELDRPVPDSTWIVRDFAAHLATLDPMMQAMFDATIAGDQFRPEAHVHERDGGFDVDAFNDEVVAERRSWPLAQVFEEGAAQRQKLIDSLAGMTDEQIAQPMYFSGDAKRRAGKIPLNLFLAGWAQHDPIHVADMLKALPERAGDPDIKSWIENPFVAGYQKAMNSTPAD